MAEATRIVILGNSGVGKSSLANSICGEDVFRVNSSPNSKTKNCQSKSRKVNGEDVHLVEFPGVFDVDPRSKDMSKELLECFTECAPGPHVFLLVLKVGRFNSYEKAVVDIILSYFTEDALKYTTIVFTHGEELPKGMKIEDWVKQNDYLKNLVQKCGDRCHVIDNKRWNKREQVKKLLVTIKTMMRENEGYYTNEMLRKIQNDIEKEKKNIRKKQINELFMVFNERAWYGRFSYDIRTIIQTEKQLMKEEPVESIPLRVDRMFLKIHTELMKTKNYYTGETLTEMLREIQKMKEQVLLMVEETLTCLAILVMAHAAVLNALILSLGGAVVGVLLGAFLGVAVMLVVVTTTSLTLLQFILGLLAVTGGIIAAGVTGGVLGWVVGGWIWGSYFSTAMKAENHLKNLDELYQKLQ